MMNFIGGYKPLVEKEVFEISAALLSILSLMPLGRSMLEGFPYNICFSTIIGDPVGLVTAVLVVVTVLQRDCGQIRLPRRLMEGLQRGSVHWVLALLSLFVGVACHFATSTSRVVTLMDLYHDLWIIPLFSYLGFILFPIIIFNGKKKEKAIFAGCIFLWLMLAIFDGNNTLMHQYQWCQHNTYFRIQHLR